MFISRNLKPKLVFLNSPCGRERETITISAGERPSGFLYFVATGFTHVLSGLDHIVFLAALALVTTRIRIAILCISGFTLGHTTSLGLSALGIINPNTEIIEAVIGLTIALTALEAGVKQRPFPKAKSNSVCFFSVSRFCWNFFSDHVIWDWHFIVHLPNYQRAHRADAPLKDFYQL